MHSCYVAGLGFDPIEPQTQRAPLTPESVLSSCWEAHALPSLGNSLWLLQGTRTGPHLSSLVSLCFFISSLSTQCPVCLRHQWSQASRGRNQIFSPFLPRRLAPTRSSTPAVAVKPNEGPGRSCKKHCCTEILNISRQSFKIHPSKTITYWVKTYSQRKDITQPYI